MAGAVVRHYLTTRFMDSETTKCNISYSLHSHTRSPYSLPLFHNKYETRRVVALMNGCEGDPKLPIGSIETRTLTTVPSPSKAMERLDVAIRELKCNPPPLTSGILRLQERARFANFFCHYLQDNGCCHMQLVYLKPN
ncbi:hypothetical protein GOBAR_AA39641 [Gossypium barbadense]|uniref:Uncharacterized protein n=1 Tax=Gossypium barbadense TaxID=3634 RepID=A0A2P5VQF1_GOSBA|nr:hypothetical protein GOBAR_AA39641 [Gossypium barbadense]